MRFVLAVVFFCQLLIEVALAWVEGGADIGLGFGKWPSGKTSMK